VQLAQLEDCPPALKRDLGHIYANVLRCRKVVDNLLSSSARAAASAAGSI